MNPIETIELELGGYQICAIPTGLFALDGGAMFGTVPKVLWERSNPPDSQNRISMEARALLLKGHGRNVLIDTGNGADFVAKFGEKLGNKFASMYGVNAEGPSLEKSLAQHGLTAGDITDVILTHLHFDHAGGGTTEKNGALVPTFPNARYHLQQRNLETAQSPNVREKASYFAANFEPLLKAQVLNLVEGDQTDLLPGISVMVSNGHTQGQQMVKIGGSGFGPALVYCADVIPTSSHIRLAWIMGYDLDPLTIIEEKRQLLKQAAAENWYLYFEHDPFCAMAQVASDGADFLVTKRFDLE